MQVTWSVGTCRAGGLPVAAAFLHAAVATPSGSRCRRRSDRRLQLFQLLMNDAAPCGSSSALGGGHRSSIFRPSSRIQTSAAGRMKTDPSHWRRSRSSSRSRRVDDWPRAASLRIGQQCIPLIEIGMLQAECGGKNGRRHLRPTSQRKPIGRNGPKKKQRAGLHSGRMRFDVGPKWTAVLL